MTSCISHNEAYLTNKPPPQCGCAGRDVISPTIALLKAISARMASECAERRARGERCSDDAGDAESLSFSSSLERSGDDTSYSGSEELEEEQQQEETMELSSLQPEINPLLLKYRTSARTARLAKPKSFVKCTDRTLPIRIPAAILRYEATDHIRRLATPRDIPDIPPPMLLGTSPAAMRYKPSERLLQLAVPIHRAPRKIEQDFQIPTITRRALRYVATERIKRLAQPLYPIPKSTHVSNPMAGFPISKKALKYRPTVRMMQLATPVEREIFSQRPIPDKIPRQVLVYEATDRIRQLARPKPHTVEHKYVNIDSLPPRAVKRSALRYKPTARIIRMAMPNKRLGFTHIPDMVLPAKIKKSVLKYKPTKHIKRLAKPKRDFQQT